MRDGWRCTCGGGLGIDIPTAGEFLAWAARSLIPFIVGHVTYPCNRQLQRRLLKSGGIFELAAGIVLRQSEAGMCVVLLCSHCGGWKGGGVKAALENVNRWNSF